MQNLMHQAYKIIGTYTLIAQTINVQHLNNNLRKKVTQSLHTYFRSQKSKIIHERTPRAELLQAERQAEHVHARYKIMAVLVKWSP
jgi:hypothetical protein